jgi:Raf kinase inhibitor-like YbhB/YbcL family protein
MRLTGHLKSTLGLLLGLAWALGTAAPPDAKSAKTVRFKMNLHSPAFAGLGAIPVKYTCQGPNVSPPLAWDKEPAGTGSLVLLVEDPDAPEKTWVHWALYNIPPGIGEIPEGLGSTPVLSNGLRQGTNDFGGIGWGGPCPPSGIHRYYFKLFALDEALDLQAGLEEPQVLKAIRGHVLAQSTLVGVYQKRLLP